MREHPWPLKNKLPANHRPFTKVDLIEFFDAIGVEEDTPVWIDNYWQLGHQIAQRPIELMYIADDGIHLG